VLSWKILGASKHGNWILPQQLRQLALSGASKSSSRNGANTNSCLVILLAIAVIVTIAAPGCHGKESESSKSQATLAFEAKVMTF
jgi:hypothetical protein